MTILHVAPVSDKAITGIRSAVPKLVEHQSQQPGVEVGLLSTSRKRYSLDLIDVPVFQTAEVGAVMSLPVPFNSPDLVVFHSTYILTHLRLARELLARGIPYIVVPHGGLGEYAQETRKWKKRLANAMGFRSFFRNAASLHFLAESEAEEAASWNRDCFVIGNGIDIPSSDRISLPGKDNHLRLVYVGRLAIHHKGLDLLIDSLRDLKSELLASNAHVYLYGPDFEKGKEHLVSLVRAYGLSEHISINDPVSGEEKNRVYQGADVFLHTSRFEGHPMAVLEALSYGVPSLLTPGTNMARQVAANEAGWQVEADAASIAIGLRKVLREKEQLSTFGANARLLAKTHYQWSSVAAQTIERYKKIVGVV